MAFWLEVGNNYVQYDGDRKLFFVCVSAVSYCHFISSFWFLVIYARHEISYLYLSRYIVHPSFVPVWETYMNTSPYALF